MVHAEAHSDDRKCEVKFDATEWFQAATDAQVVNLSKCEWGGDYPADEVATDSAGRVTELADLFKYIETRNKNKTVCGFECHVDEASAMEWLAANRPDLHDRIKTGQETGEDRGCTYEE